MIDSLDRSSGGRYLYLVVLAEHRRDKKNAQKINGVGAFLEGTANYSGI